MKLFYFLWVFVIDSFCRETGPITYYVYVEQCVNVLCSKVFINATTSYNAYNNSIEFSLTCSEPLPLDAEESMRPWKIFLGDEFYQSDGCKKWNRQVPPFCNNDVYLLLTKRHYCRKTCVSCNLRQLQQLELELKIYMVELLELLRVINRPITYYVYVEQCVNVLCSKVFINATTSYNAYNNSIEFSLTCSEPLPLDAEESMRSWKIFLGDEFYQSDRPLCSYSPQKVILPADNKSSIGLLSIDSWESFASVSLLRIAQNNDSFVVMSNRIVSVPYVDHDAQCSTDQDTLTKMCMCRSPKTVEEYCNKVKNQKYSGTKVLTEYHVFGEVYNQMYESYNFYTSIFYPELYYNYFLWCNMPIRSSPQSRYNSSQISAVFGSSNSWPEDMCESSSHKYIQRKYISSLEVDFFLPDMENENKNEAERHVFPVDVRRWRKKLIEGDCVIVQTSAFSKYCYCAGKNKSESFCRLSTNRLKPDASDNGQNGSDYHESKNDDSSDTENVNGIDDDSSKNFSTIPVPLDNANEIEDDDAWRWHDVKLNEKILLP